MRRPRQFPRQAPDDQLGEGVLANRARLPKKQIGFHVGQYANGVVNRANRRRSGARSLLQKSFLFAVLGNDVSERLSASAVRSAASLRAGIGNGSDTLSE